jgi:hypothetical protein
MNNDNITLVKEPSFVIQTSTNNNKFIGEDFSDHDRDQDRDRPLVDESPTTTAVAPPSPFTNVEVQIENDQNQCGSTSLQEANEQKDRNISSSAVDASLESLPAVSPISITNEDLLTKVQKPERENSYHEKTEEKSRENKVNFEKRHEKTRENKT